MKSGVLAWLVTLALLSSPAVGVQVVTSKVADGSSARGGAVGEVVTMLKDLLKTSQDEGKSERTLYADYKCYCDENEAIKKESIRTLGTEVGIIENDIEDLRSSNGQLS